MVKTMGWGPRSMKIKQIIFAYCVGGLLLTGCNHLRTFPLYSEISVNNSEHVQLFEDLNVDYFLKELPNSDITREYLSIKERVSEYLSKNDNISPGMAVALKQHMVKRGMNQEQVVLLIGEPTTKRTMKDNGEQWFYGKDRKFQWYYDWGKLYFHDGLLTNIERKSIKIYK